MASGVAADEHHSALQVAFGIFAMVLLVLILVYLAVLITRRKRIRGAANQKEVWERAFGKRAAKWMGIGCFVVAGICFIGAFLL